MAKEDLQRILIKGGILAPSELKNMLKMCKEMKLDNISFGSRQDILFPPTENQDAILEQYPKIGVEKVRNKKHHNIVSSYLTVDIFEKTSWVNSSTFLYVLGQLKEENTLSINIVDPRQQFVPLFTGSLNFLTSQHDSYWYLYIKLPHWKSLVAYPVLIHTMDVAAVTEAIQEFGSEMEDVNKIFEVVNQSVDPSKNRNFDKKPILSKDLFPYYEGMHRMEGNSYWLGLYWRDNNYYIDFLDAVADLCNECKIGNLCITPWKSIIIKKIHKKDKLRWEKLLGRFGINVRHSLLELNWHIPVNDVEALDLKRYIVRVLDQNDISTYGLTLGIYSYSSINYYTTIVIQRNEKPKLMEDIDIRPTYNILHAKNFRSNETKYITYAQDIDKLELPGLLIELSKTFFEHLGEENDSEFLSEAKKTKAVIAENVFQCQDCYSIYDPIYGEPMRDISPGTKFESLNPHFTCAVCDAPISEFKEISKEKLMKASEE